MELSVHMLKTVTYYPVKWNVQQNSFKVNFKSQSLISLNFSVSSNKLRVYLCVRKTILRTIASRGVFN